jgi:hypothetical protein
MKLVTMSGCKGRLGQPKFQFSLFSMAGAADVINIDPSELDDVEAGIWFLYWLNKMYPGVTWGDIYNATHNDKLGRSWFGRTFSSIGSFIGTGVSDMGDKMGEWSGDAIRLLTDREVSEGIGQYAQIASTSGTSEGIKGFLGQLGGLMPDTLKNKLLSSLGQNVKTASAPQLIQGVDNKVLYIGGGALLLILLIARR